VSQRFSEALRRIYPQVLAKTLARSRCLADAEDAVQDALAAALERWPSSGVPDSPEAWLLTVATHRLYDQHRSVRRHGALEQLADMSPWLRIALGEAEIAHGWKDDLLRLLFACCHPALEPGEGAALTLSTVVGLSVRELAAAFAVAPRSMEQRLTRARQRLRERGDGEGVGPGQAHERLDAVLRALYLLFNEGYWSTDDQAPIRADLCRLATGLARSLHEAFPGEPEVQGLLALFLLHDARRSARLSSGGQPVPLPEQDRTCWDQAAIASAAALLQAALARGRPGPLQIEAAISATHCRASSAEQTDWPEIAALYALLEVHKPTPAVRANRAFAAARAWGPAAGLALLEAAGDGLAHVDLVRGALLQELGALAPAREALLRAVAQARNAHERAAIGARLEQIDLATRRET
jgi:RNA polymerase sigma-70 factor (ECF subfamily)